ENREKTAPPGGTPLTWRLGRLADALTGAGRNGRRSYTEICAEKRETLVTGNRLVLRSFSFGLLAVCIGIAATLIYVFLRIRG
ncbi:MAG: hypothetical protein IJL69_00125, partial [Oscillospiraceae bacterium]|nr:hypothetical protein [Oscillospiraceae bacterium]